MLLADLLLDVSQIVRAPCLLVGQENCRGCTGRHEKSFARHTTLIRRSISAWQPQEARRNEISESKPSQRNKNSATATALQTKTHRGSVYHLNPIARITASDFWLQKLK